MRISRRRASPQRELVAHDPISSFAAFRFRSPSFPFVWHYHPEVELTYIVRGTGLRFLGDSIEAFGPGDLILIGENVPHTWQSSNSKALPDGPVEAIVIQFPANLLGNAMETLPELRAIQKALTNSARGLSVDDAALRELVFIQMEQLTAKPAGGAERLLGLIHSLHLIAEAFGKKKRAVRHVSQSPHNDARCGDASTRRLERVLQSLHESLDTGNSFTQSDAARLVQMSPASFSRFFHRKVGRTFARYVKEWRVELACRELVQSKRPITEIAFDSGFENLSNFNRRFRELKGMTPREFRRLRGV